MTVKGRSSTLCEWALGVSVEEYCDSVQRRRRRQSRGRQRISVEISTDDESEEDTVKITYPRALGKKTSAQSANIKKVRFLGEEPKSALKAADSDADSSGDSEPDPDCKCRDCKKGRRRLKKEGKEVREKTAETDAFDSEEELKPKKGGKKKQKKEKSSTKKKVIESSSESEIEDGKTETTETEPESEDEAPPSPKKKKDQKKKKGGQSAEQSKETASAVVETNNVGPTKKRADKNDATKKERHRSKKPEKLRPEAALSPNLRRPNLIMPVRAEVIQVEHAIEGAEDPRPNAFHDSQHGVVRVYHGPAYGNPYGLLYPARDPSKATLPLGMPHPLQNPYFHGFANPDNPGDNQFKGQSPWGSIPFTCMPGGPPIMATVDQMHMPQIPPYWAPISPVNAASANGSTKMSRANQGETASTAAKDKEKGWETNVGPDGNKAPSPAKSEKTKPFDSNVAPKSPINIHLSVNPNTPWAEITSNLSKKSSPHKNGSQAGSKTGSNNGSKKSWGSKKSGTNWQPLESGQHPDLTWSTSKNQSGSNSGWPQTNDGNNQNQGMNNVSGSNNVGGGSNSGWNNTSNNWNTTSGQSNDTSGSSGNDAQRAYSSGDGWNTTTNDATGGNSSRNNQLMVDDGSGASNNNGADAWANSGGDYNNKWGTASNHSNKSKKSNKNQNGEGSNRNTSRQQQPATNWDNQSNNVGFTGRAISNGSNISPKPHRSQGPPSNDGWDNNAGPSTNSPVGNASNKSNGSKSSAKMSSNNGEQWNNTGDNSTWIPDNNAGPTSNSPNTSQTSKKSEKNNTTAGEGAGWGPAPTGDGWNPTGTEMSKGSSSGKSMPGSWDNNVPWANPNVAISTNGAADAL